jgi:phosphoribosylformylglycinamidine cyclo-ligase
LQQLGSVEPEEMLRTFNMGIGLIAAVPADKFKRAKSMLDRAGEKFWVIGRTVKGDRKVLYT